MWGVRYLILQMYLKASPSLVNSDVDTVYILGKELNPPSSDDEESEDDDEANIGSGSVNVSQGLSSTRDRINRPTKDRYAILTVNPAEEKALTYALDYTYDISLA